MCSSFQITCIFFLIICDIFGKNEDCKEENTKFPNAPKKAYNGIV